MKTYYYPWKNFLVFFFFLFATITFSQTTDTYTTSGNWTVPAGVTSVTVQIWGAGGGGGGSNSNNNGGSGGGSGAYVSRIIPITPGTYAFTIGTGGAAGAASNAVAGTGGNSTITLGGFTLTANGGTGGTGNSGAAGTGGTATGGTTNTNGNSGSTGGGSGGNGASSPNGGTGGIGNTNAAGSAGSTPGAGGGGGERGGGDWTGGAGARGEIRFTYLLPGSYCTIGTTTNTYWISNFTTTGGTLNINNTSTYSTGGYGNFTAQTVSQMSGNSFNFNTTINSGTHGINIWVDWNNDTDFDDAGEKVYTSGSYVASANGTITIPVGTTAGNYRMRVVADYFSTDPTACGSKSYTEAEDYTVQVTAPPACSGTPTAGTTITSPVSGSPGSSYTVSTSGFTNATGLTYQWQYSTNGGGLWTNAGASSGTYSNYIATAPALGITTLWRLVVTCTSSGLSTNSASGTFTSVSTQNIPSSGSNTVTCGTNIVLYDNGGAGADYSNNSTGYTVLEAGLSATINISGNYVTESGLDIIRIYSGIGTGGTLLASYSGTGTINYTGTAGQTLTVQFSSDSSLVYSGFSLSVSYTGVCFPVCSGTPTGGTVTTSPNTGWPSSSYSAVATGYTQALDMTYQWQYSTDAGATWTNAGAATSSYANYNATAPASGDVHWQLVVTCTNSSQTATSSTGIFTTMVVSDVETGCPNVVSGGLGLNGADPAPFNCTAASTCVDLEATYLDLGETTDYIVEPILYNPPFSFSGLANPVSVNTDDVWSPVVNLPFDFCFYGNTYNQCVIGSNGILTFNTSLAGTASGYSFNNNIPISGNAQLRENSIFGVFHDIDPGVGGEVGWELITLPTGCRALVASWSDVPMFDENAILYSGMMVLYENSNIIEVYIKEKNIDNFGAGTWNNGNAIVGIQNATGTLATVPPGRNGLDANWSTANEAWRFVPNGNSIASIAWYEGSGTTGPVVGTTPTLNVCPTSTTTYTAEITYTLCDGSTIKETDETTVTVNGAKVWNGSVSTNWDIANNWTPTGVPTALDCVVIPDTANDPIIIGTNYNGLGLNLTIDNNANLTITSNNDLTITDWININTTGDLILQNSASLIQINNDVNQGTMHMTRTANIRKLDYVYWSSPVADFSVNTISPGTTGYKYKWTPTIPSNVNGFGNWVAANENMGLGKGYIVRGPDNFTSTIAPFNAVFAGTPNNGIITTPVFRGTWNGGSYSTGVSATLGTNNDDNWNLIGNPYPSAVNVIDFLTLNTNIDGFINIWTHGTLPNSAITDPFYNDYAYNYTPGDYNTYNSSGASSGPSTFDGYIGAGQGFFVLMNHTSASASENITFNNSMRSSTYDNGQFFRASNDNGRIWLDLIASNGSNVRNLVAYADGATNNRDRMFDAVTDEKLSLNLYSSIGNEFMKIQGRTLPFDNEDRVPMGIKVPQNGNYTIGIAAVDGFFTNESQNIYLEDKENNIIHDLRENPYSFTALAGNHPNRFVLRYTNETLGGDDPIADEANLWVISSDVLSVKSTKNTIQSVRVFDVLGRHLAYYPNVEGYEVPLTTIQKNNAVLIVQVTLSNGAIVNKKVIF